MKEFIAAIVSIILVTILSTLLSFIFTYNNLNLSHENWCFTSKCINDFEKAFSGPIKILKFGTSSVWIFVLVSGVYIALKNYLTSVKATSLSGHISHLTMFKDYLDDEIKNYELLKLQKIDIFIWYKKAFPCSSMGDISVPPSYIMNIKAIADAVTETNSTINSPKGNFGYRKHQDRLKAAFSVIGIEVSYMPRNAFHDVEAELFKLIDSINHTFTEVDISLSSLDRAYI